MTKRQKMKKFLKKSRKLRKKLYGGTLVKSDTINTNTNTDTNNDTVKNGIFDIAGEKVSGFALNTANYLKNKGLRLFGMQPINQDSQPQNQNNSTNINNITTSASGIVSDIANVVNKTSGSIIENMNEVLGSPQVNEGVSQAAEKTEVIAENLLKTFNEKLNNPELKAQLTESLNNVADYTEIGVQAMNKPIDSAIDKLNEAGTKAIAGVASGAVKVGTDLVASVPYIGAVVDLGKAINDGSKAVGSVIEAGSEATEALAELIGNTSENLNKGIQELKEKKNEGQQILNRANSSINSFENPTKKFSEMQSAINKNGILKGGVSRKHLKKRKDKSRRVRFSD